MEKDKKWLAYEKRWKFRDFYFKKALRRHIVLKYFNREPVMIRYAHKWVMSTSKTNQYIAGQIKSGRPFMAARFGNTELFVMTSVLRERLLGKDPANTERLKQWFSRGCCGAGFFPEDISLAYSFTDTMLEACKEVDLLGMWHLEMEDYVITEYLPQARLTYLQRLEPWLAGNPWSAALEGKKVLVIHPFEETIRAQYRKREKLFPGTRILPEFELQTLKAVQTFAGETDARFAGWHDALSYLYEEAMKMDFDVAVLGCGAYGFPLAAMLKRAGKQAVHLGGATQLMFGIKGKRWENNYPSKIGRCFNQHWTYPSDREKPKNASAVESGCYWK